MTGARSKVKTSPKGKVCTYGAVKRGLVSPLAHAAGNFQKKGKV